MKRFTAILLSFLLLCSVLCACTPTETDNNTPKQYSIGTLTSTGWQSSWIGLQYTPDSSMVMATDKDIEDMMQVGADMMYEENGQQMIDWAKVTTVYEMMATNVSTGSNVIVCAEKIALSNMTVAQYMDALKTQLATVYSNVNFSTPVTQKVGGIDFTRSDLTASYNGYSINQTYMVVKMDNRMVSLIFTCTTSDALESMLAGFSAYNG